MNTSGDIFSESFVAGVEESSPQDSILEISSDSDDFVPVIEVSSESDASLDRLPPLIMDLGGGMHEDGEEDDDYSGWTAGSSADLRRISYTDHSEEMDVLGGVHPVDEEEEEEEDLFETQFVEYTPQDSEPSMSQELTQVQQRTVYAKKRTKGFVFCDRCAQDFKKISECYEHELQCTGLDL